MKRLISLSLILIMTIFVVNVYAQDSTFNVELPVTYGQTEARTMLNMVNEFRTGSDAWIINEDNQTKTTFNNLEELTYDYELERFAMQRAAEIALNFSHTRPNGELCFTVYENRTGAKAENIALGQRNATQAFVAWKEENENYDGQGHRRNMLSSNYKSIGIGHAYYKGYHFWVQEFSSIVKDTTPVNANNNLTNVPVQISSSLISARTMQSSNGISVTYGEKIDLPEVNQISLALKETFGNLQCDVIVPYTWTMQDENYAKIVEDKIEGIKVGDTTINTVIFNDNVSVPVHVVAKNISNATVTVETPKYTYDGTAKEPKATVTLDGKTLTENDYQIKYVNNVNVGKANVIAQGKGNYTGSATGNFEICCNHENVIIDNAVPATCTKDGLTEGKHCEDCNTILVKQTKIPALGHKWDNGTIVKKATCTEKGIKIYTCTNNKEHTETETIPALGHRYKTNTQKATLSKNGSIVEKCTTCGNVKITPIYYPKTISLSKTTFTYNGRVQKPTVTVKGSDGKVISASNYTVQYPSGLKNVGRYSVKIIFKGNYSGTKTLTYDILPAGTTINKLTSAKKAFTAKLKKQTKQTTGYEIQYSTNSKFNNGNKTVNIAKNSTIQKKLTKLKAKKKYYVRVRTYKIVKINGKNVKLYSAWSKVKSITTKK